VGAETLPGDGPLVLVANHHNSLVDPALILAKLPAQPRFLAKSTLWEIPLLRNLLNWARVVPVYRQQDEGEDTSRNTETFAACFDELANGGAVALFPEGISHDAPHLARLKTGAARIALGAEERSGPLGVQVVPVGLTFERKGRFRSRALVRVGEAIAVEPFAKRQKEEPREAARELTERIRIGLESVTLNHPSEEEAGLVARASELFAVADRELPAQLALAEAFALRQAFITGLDRVRQQAPEQVGLVAQRVLEYEAELSKRGLRDDQVAARYPSGEVAAVAVGTAALLFFWLPFAAVGTLLNFVPYRLLGIGARFTKTEDLPATVKLFGGFLLFPLTWLLWTALTAGTLGAGAALGMALLAPGSAWIAMRFHERYERFFDEAVSYLRLVLRPREAERLRRLREAVRHEVRDLARLADRSGGGDDGSAGGGEA
jgi:1-acyl-sn-glycerol-3-phosphate acyltransferase